MRVISIWIANSTFTTCSLVCPLLRIRLCIFMNAGSRVVNPAMVNRLPVWEREREREIQIKREREEGQKEAVQRRRLMYYCVAVSLQVRCLLQRSHKGSVSHPVKALASSNIFHPDDAVYLQPYVSMATPGSSSACSSSAREIEEMRKGRTGTKSQSGGKWALRLGVLKTDCEISNCTQLWRLWRRKKRVRISFRNNCFRLEV